MKMWWLVSVFLVAVLLLLSGCAPMTPSVGGGVTLTIRVVSKTQYEAQIELTLANRSTLVFYPRGSTIKAEFCERGGECVEHSEEFTDVAGVPLLPGDVRSAEDLVPIGDELVYMRWMEITITGTLGDQPIEVQSNRVYF